MTYIIAGKLSNSTFMMADCISTDTSTNAKSFINKLHKLQSSKDTYYSFTGSSIITFCVQHYDYWLSINNRNNDFIEGLRSIDELITAIKIFVKNHPEQNKLCLKENRLFFLDNANVVYYDLKFDRHNEVIGTQVKKSLVEDYYVDTMLNFPSERISLPTDADMKEYCIAHFKSISKGNVDFKNRYSFVQLFDNGIIDIQHPYKTFSDLVASFYYTNFENLDNDDFKCDI